MIDVRRGGWVARLRELHAKREALGFRGVKSKLMRPTKPVELPVLDYTRVTSADGWCLMTMQLASPNMGRKL